MASGRVTPNRDAAAGLLREAERSAGVAEALERANEWSFDAWRTREICFQIPSQGSRKRLLQAFKDFEDARIEEACRDLFEAEADLAKAQREAGERSWGLASIYPLLIGISGAFFSGAKGAAVGAMVAAPLAWQTLRNAAATKRAAAERAKEAVRFAREHLDRMHADPPLFSATEISQGVPDASPAGRIPS